MGLLNLNQSRRALAYRDSGVRGLYQQLPGRTGLGGLYQQRPGRVGLGGLYQQYPGRVGLGALGGRSPFGEPNRCGSGFLAASQVVADQLGSAYKEADQAINSAGAELEEAMAKADELSRSLPDPSLALAVMDEVDAGQAKLRAIISQLSSLEATIRGREQEMLNRGLCTYSGVSPLVQEASGWISKVKRAASDASNIPASLRSTLLRLDREIESQNRAAEEREAAARKAREDAAKIQRDEAARIQREEDEIQRRKDEARSLEEEARRREDERATRALEEERRLRELELDAQERAAQRESAERTAEIERARQSELAQIEAEERRAALVIEQKQAQFQLLLQQLQAELQREQALLAMDLQRLQAEEQLAAQRSEREFALEAQRAAIAAQAAQAAIAPSGPTFSPTGFPTMPLPASQQRPQSDPAALFQQTPLFQSSARTATPEFSPPPSGGFEMTAFTPGGEMFGLGGLVAHRNANLPAEAVVEQGYKIHGPTGGSFTVERPSDGSTFKMSTKQAFKPGVRVTDPQTQKVFYANRTSPPSGEEVTSKGIADSIREFTSALLPGVTAGVKLARGEEFDATTGASAQQPLPRRGVSPLLLVGAGAAGLAAIVAFRRRGKKKK